MYMQPIYTHSLLHWHIDNSKSLTRFGHFPNTRTLMLSNLAVSPTSGLKPILVIFPTTSHLDFGHFHNNWSLTSLGHLPNIQTSIHRGQCLHTHPLDSGHFATFDCWPVLAVSPTSGVWYMVASVPAPGLFKFGYFPSIWSQTAFAIFQTPSPLDFSQFCNYQSLTSFGHFPNIQCLSHCGKSHSQSFQIWVFPNICSQTSFGQFSNTRFSGLWPVLKQSIVDQFWPFPQHSDLDSLRPISQRPVLTNLAVSQTFGFGPILAIFRTPGLWTFWQQSIVDPFWPFPQHPELDSLWPMSLHLALSNLAVSQTFGSRPILAIFPTSSCLEVCHFPNNRSMTSFDPYPWPNTWPWLTVVIRPTSSLFKLGCCPNIWSLTECCSLCI